VEGKQGGLILETSCFRGSLTGLNQVCDRYMECDDLDVRHGLSKSVWKVVCRNQGCKVACTSNKIRALHAAAQFQCTASDEDWPGLDIDLAACFEESETRRGFVVFDD